jgi:signal transduction histidine kinase
MTGSRSGSLEIPWPSWLAKVYASAITALVVSALITGGATPWRLALAGCAVVVAWAGCITPLPELHLVGALATVVLTTLLATAAQDVILFVVVITCAGSAIEEELVPSGGIAALAVVLIFARAATLHINEGIVSWAPWPVGYAAAWAGGLFVRSQVALAAQLQANQEVVSAKAAAEERRRLAREIHD